MGGTGTISIPLIGQRTTIRLAGIGRSFLPVARRGGPPFRIMSGMTAALAGKQKNSRSRASGVFSIRSIRRPSWKAAVSPAFILITDGKTHRKGYSISIMPASPCWTRPDFFKTTRAPPGRFVKTTGVITDGTLSLMAARSISASLSPRRTCWPAST